MDVYDHDSMGGHDFMGRAFLRFDAMPSPPASKEIMLELEPRLGKKEKVSGVITVRVEYVAIQGSGSNLASLQKRNASVHSLPDQQRSTAHLATVVEKAAQWLNSDLVQISASGKKVVQVPTSLSSQFISFSELPCLESLSSKAELTKNEKKFGYSNSHALWAANCCQLAYRTQEVIATVCKSVWGTPACDSQFFFLH